MVTSLTKGRDIVSDETGKPVRRVKISKQRQISIPKDFYNTLNLGDEALVELTGNSIVIRPARSEEVDFSEDILKDLVYRGYSGESLIREFQKIKSDIPRALDYMKKEAMNQAVITDSLGDYLDSLDEDKDE